MPDQMTTRDDALQRASRIKLMIFDVDGVLTDGALYYADKYWKPEQYWHWQDRVWTQPPEGKVEVGPIQNPPEH